jgi:hypothetical protein
LLAERQVLTAGLEMESFQLLEAGARAARVPVALLLEEAQEDQVLNALLLLESSLPAEAEGALNPWAARVSTLVQAELAVEELALNRQLNQRQAQVPVAPQELEVEAEAEALVAVEAVALSPFHFQLPIHYSMISTLDLYLMPLYIAERLLHPRS